jgi:hypothetical protein
MAVMINASCMTTRRMRTDMNRIPMKCGTQIRTLSRRKLNRRKLSRRRGQLRTTSDDMPYCGRGLGTHNEYIITMRMFSLFFYLLLLICYCTKPTRALVRLSPGGGTCHSRDIDRPYSFSCSVDLRDWEASLIILSRSHFSLSADPRY